MQRWIVKSVLQSAISLLPASPSWNYVIQKHITKSLDMRPAWFNYKLKQCRQHVENYSAHAAAAKPSFCCLELGAGWHPIIPIGLYLCGASQVWTLDRTRLLRRATVNDVLRCFAQSAAAGELKQRLPHLREDRLPTLTDALRHVLERPVDETLAKLGIRVVIGDTRDTDLPDRCIDLIVSNNTLEHIPKSDLLGIFTEFKRLAASSSVMSHLVDMSDHYSHFDPSITPYNFLRYSDRQWRWINNWLGYQNRLRVSDYRWIHEATGFRILSEESRTGPVEVLDSIRLAADFHGYTREELLATSSWLVSTCSS